jgi:hypothetical protein
VRNPLDVYLKTKLNRQSPLKSMTYVQKVCLAGHSIERPYKTSAFFALSAVEHFFSCGARACYELGCRDFPLTLPAAQAVPLPRKRGEGQKKQIFPFSPLAWEKG